MKLSLCSPFLFVKSLANHCEPLTLSFMIDFFSWNHRPTLQFLATTSSLPIHFLREIAGQLCNFWRRHCLSRFIFFVKSPANSAISAADIVSPDWMFFPIFTWNRWPTLQFLAMTLSLPIEHSLHFFRQIAGQFWNLWRTFIYDSLLCKVYFCCLTLSLIKAIESLRSQNSSLELLLSRNFQFFKPLTSLALVSRQIHHFSAPQILRQINLGKLGKVQNYYFVIFADNLCHAWDLMVTFPV